MGKIANTVANLKIYTEFLEAVISNERTDTETVELRLEHPVSPYVNEALLSLKWVKELKKGYATTLAKAEPKQARIFIKEVNKYIPKEVKTLVCSYCAEKKNVSEFNVSKGTKTGYTKRCKSCIEALNKTRTELKTQTYKCCKCGNIKPITDFHKDRSSNKGHKSKCKECSSIKSVEKPKQSITYNENRLVEYVKELQEENKSQFKQICDLETDCNNLRKEILILDEVKEMNVFQFLKWKYSNK